jgi:hypothetical protein
MNLPSQYGPMCIGKDYDFCRFRTLFDFALLSLFHAEEAAGFPAMIKARWGATEVETVTVTRKYHVILPKQCGQPSTSLSETNP